MFHSITLCYYEQKIQELRECFEAKQQELDDQLQRLKNELQVLDNQFAELEQEESDQNERAEELDKFKDIWRKRQAKFQRELQHLEQLKEQLHTKFMEDCKSAKQQLETKIKPNQAEVLPSGRKQDVPARPEIQSAPNDEVKIKEDNKLILDKFVFVQSKIAAISSALTRSPKKRPEANEDPLRQLDQANEDKLRQDQANEDQLDLENWSLKEQINILSKRLDRKNHGCELSTVHLDNLELKFLQLLKTQSSKN